MAIPVWHTIYHFASAMVYVYVQIYHTRMVTLSPKIVYVRTVHVYVPVSYTLSQKRLEIQVHVYTVYHGSTNGTYLFGTCVRTYQMVRIILCHNFLIGKGHTCALRTTCVLGGYTAAS